MENKPVRKITKAVAALTMTAMLATIPATAVDVDYTASAEADNWHAMATVKTFDGTRNISVSVELSCMFGPVYGPTTYTENGNEYEAYAFASYDTAPGQGEILGTRASAWIGSDRVANAYWPE